MNNIDAIILEPSSRAHLQAMVQDSPDVLALIEACYKTRLSPFHACAHSAADAQTCSQATDSPGPHLAVAVVPDSFFTVQWQCICAVAQYCNLNERLPHACRCGNRCPQQRWRENRS